MALNQILGQIGHHESNGLNLGLRKVKREMLGINKALAFAANEEKTICTISGKGYVDTCWFGMSANNTLLKNALLKIFVDGEASPSVQFDLGSLGLQLATGYANGWSANTWVQCNSSYPSEMVCFKFPVPYSTGIVIKLKSQVLQTASITSYIYNVRDVDIPFRLKSVNIPYLNKVTILNSDNTIYEFFNLAGSGWLAWHSMTMEPVTDNSCLQSLMNIYVDGEVTPSINSVNLLNWFMDSNDFNQFPMSTSWRSLSICPWGGFFVRKFSVGINLLELSGGIKFNSGIRATMDTTPAAMATDFSFSSNWLYYQPVQG